MDEVQSSAAVRSYTWGLDLVSEHQTLNSALTTSYYVFDGLVGDAEGRPRLTRTIRLTATSTIQWRRGWDYSQALFA